MNSSDYDENTLPFNPNRTGGGGGCGIHPPPLDVSRDNFTELFFCAPRFRNFGRYFRTNRAYRSEVMQGVGGIPPPPPPPAVRWGQMTRLF